MNYLHEDAQKTIAGIGKEMQALAPNPRELKRQMFAQLYPIIVERLDAGVTQKAILDLLAKHELKMHPAKFKRLMEEESATANGLQGTATEGESR